MTTARKVKLRRPLAVAPAPRHAPRQAASGRAPLAEPTMVITIRDTRTVHAKWYRTQRVRLDVGTDELVLIGHTPGGEEVIVSVRTGPLLESFEAWRKNTQDGRR